MKDKLKVLLVTDGAWNDKIYGNNVYTNWFSQFNAEIANVYRGDISPSNNLCRRYYKLSDSDLIRAIFKGGSCGCELENRSYFDEGGYDVKGEMDKLSRVSNKYKNDFVRLLRNLIWMSNCWKTEEFKQFLIDFDPDVIFTVRYARYGFLRIEEYIYEVLKKPIVAFTADNEYSLRQVEFAPSWWISRFMTRNKLRQMVKHYSYYLTFSPQQASEYQTQFGCRTEVLYKGAAFEKCDKQIGDIIRIIYAGRLYCNRWKVLRLIGKIIDEVNTDKRRFSLEVYSPDFNKKLASKLSGVNVHGCVPQEELQRIMQTCDIALHVESFDYRSSIALKYSFSTKIIDCLASGCAIMAVSNSINAGYNYLYQNDIALCACNKNELRKLLFDIANDPGLIEVYREKAYRVGKEHHEKSMTEEKLYAILKRASEDNV